MAEQVSRFIVSFSEECCDENCNCHCIGEGCYCITD